MTNREQIKKLEETNITEQVVYSNESLKEMGYKPESVDELNQRTRDIRISWTNIDKVVCDKLSQCTDYDPNSEDVKNLFASLHNKPLYAITGCTAAELRKKRADANKPYMGVIARKSENLTKEDIKTAVNYLTQKELKEYQLLLEQYLSLIESLMLKPGASYTMKDLIIKLDAVLKLNDKPPLVGYGNITRKEADRVVLREYKKYKEKLKQQKALSVVAKSKAPVVKRIVKKKKLVS